MYCYTIILSQYYIEMAIWFSSHRQLVGLLLRLSLATMLTFIEMQQKVFHLLQILSDPQSLILIYLWASSFMKCTVMIQESL
ncbi:hypothetical protein CF140_17545 [Aeromonas sobria]|nr:hypothetical protein CF140_17545 [Aeromonas sobria]